MSWKEKSWDLLSRVPAAEYPELNAMLTDWFQKVTFFHAVCGSTPLKHRQLPGSFQIGSKKSDIQKRSRSKPRFSQNLRLFFLLPFLLSDIQEWWWMEKSGRVVAPTGLEPVTNRLWVDCSNQLSYGAWEKLIFSRKSVNFIRSHRFIQIQHSDWWTDYG